MLKKLIAVSAVMFGLIGFSSIPAQAATAPHAPVSTPSSLTSGGDWSAKTPAGGQKAPHTSAVPHQFIPKGVHANSVLTTCEPYCWYYNIGSIAPVANQTGMYAGMDVYKPTVNTVHDYHSLAEIAIQDTTNGNTIELGWVVDTAGGNPKLFASVWKAGAFQGWNALLSTTAAGCGQTSFSSPTPGNAFTGTYPQLVAFGVEHTGTWPTGAWFLKAGATGWAGCFRDADLSAAGFTSFTSGDYFQVFGEVESHQDTALGHVPCSMMGSGVHGGGAVVTGAARVGNVQYQAGSAELVDLYLHVGGPTQTVYDMKRIGTAPARVTGYTYGGDNTLC